MVHLHAKAPENRRPSEIEKISNVDTAGGATRDRSDGCREPSIVTAVDTVLDEFAKYLPQRAAVAGFGKVLYDRHVVDRVLFRNVPSAYFSPLTDTRGELSSPVLARCLDRREPLPVRATRTELATTDAWLGNFVAHGFEDCVVDAVTDALYGRFCFVTLFNFGVNLDGAVAAVRGACTLPLQEIWRREHAALAGNSDFPSLSSIEAELLELIRLGRTNKEIARTLCKSEATIRTQVHMLLAKTGTLNRTHLAVRFTRGRGS